jgi:S1-C subfamily serine protease
MDQSHDNEELGSADTTAPLPSAAPSGDSWAPHSPYEGSWALPPRPRPMSPEPPYQAPIGGEVPRVSADAAWNDASGPGEHAGYAGYGSAGQAAARHWAPADPDPTRSFPTGGGFAGPPAPPPTWGAFSLPPAQPAQPATPAASSGRGRRRVLRAAAAVIVVAATTAAGIGLGHDVWKSTPSYSSQALSPTTTSPASGSTTTPNNNSGSNGSGSGATGDTGGSGGSGGSGGFPFGGLGSGTGSGNTGGSSSSASGSPSNVSGIASSVAPGLVDVVTTLGYEGGQAAGTGIVLTSSGEVLTNNHVIDGATNIQVTDIGNGHTYTATVVGYDRTSDVAVIQLQGASGLRTAMIGDSSKVTVGEGVVAIGNAGGVGGTPSSAGGSVTGLDQTITASDEDGSNSEQLSGLIEINADIQPGDSGGSLVNSSGQVIGMDTAASTSQEFASSTTDGYAIPIDYAVSLAQQIEAQQASSTIHIGRTGFLGVSVESLNSGASGAQVHEVLAGTPAAAAGLADGDVITAVNGQTVASPDGLTNLLLLHNPGNTIQLTWTDSSGQSHTASVTLENGPAQ